MRILIVTTSYPIPHDKTWGPFVHSVAKGISLRGHHVKIITMNNKPETEYFMIDGIEVCAVGYHKNPQLHTEPGIVPSIQKNPVAIFQLWNLFRSMKKCLKDEVQSFRPDVVHAHWLAPSGMIVRNTCIRCNTPYVVTGWGADLHLPIVWPITKLLQAVTHSSSGFSVVSAYLQERCISYDLPSPIVIPNSVDTSTFTPNRREEDSTRMRIVIVSRLVPHKNVLRAIQAVKKLCIQTDVTVQLTVVGEGVLQEKVQKSLDELPIQTSLLQSIPNSDMPTLFSKQDVLVHLSSQEGLPTVLLEAMSCGVVPVVLDYSFFEDIISHRKNGMICSKESLSEVVASLQELIDATLRNTLAHKAHETIQKTYSHKTIAEQYELLYTSALSSQPRSAQL